MNTSYSDICNFARELVADYHHEHGADIHINLSDLPESELNNFAELFFKYDGYQLAPFEDLIETYSKTMERVLQEACDDYRCDWADDHGLVAAQHADNGETYWTQRS